MASSASSPGLRSMTGFGASKRADADHEIRLDLRSVNHRGLTWRSNLPAELARIEPEIDARIRASLTRGSISVGIHIETLLREPSVAFDRSIAAAYAEELSQLAAGLGLQAPDLASILTLPGVMRPQVQKGPDPNLVLAALDDALLVLIDCRQREGALLSAELRRLCAELAQRLTSIEERWPQVVDEYRERLEKRIRAFLTERGHAVEEADVLREVAIWADKTDVAEEVLRFRAHLDELCRLLSSDAALGRRLEFLGQELLREANTMAAKSSDAALAQEVVEIKATLDRIKEQGQNLE